MGLFDFFSRSKKETLDQGLEKTKQSFLDKIKRAVLGG
jgi:fused signal recognition particle receptor